VRRFPSSQRFEPLVPGITLFLSDGWCAGDPMLTWGNYKIVGRQPMLGGVSQNWHGSNPNSEPSVHGGPQGKTFFETTMEMIPEVPDYRSGANRDSLVLQWARSVFGWIPEP
jgi:hypothetical protein